MKKRVFNPDFTSLLDVIMIILFFFILFSRLDVAEAQKKAEDAMNQASSMMEEADAQMDEAQEKEDHAQDMLDQLEESDARAAANIEGLADFKAGIYLIFRLEMNKDAEHWKLNVLCDNTTLDTIESSNSHEVATRIIEAINKKGYSKEDTVIGLFEYDGTAGGSYAAIRLIESAFDIVNNDYKYIYISEYELP